MLPPRTHFTWSFFCHPRTSKKIGKILAFIRQVVLKQHFIRCNNGIFRLICHEKIRVPNIENTRKLVKEKKKKKRMINRKFTILDGRLCWYRKRVHRQMDLLLHALTFWPLLLSVKAEKESHPANHKSNMLLLCRYRTCLCAHVQGMQQDPAMTPRT